MKLSIVVPFYNAELYIERCLYSLINQDINSNDYEILMIDDGSIDNGKDIVESFINKHANIKLYSQPNIGLGATRNRGMQLAKGDYIYFIDVDDYIAYNTFGNILNCAIENDIEILGFNTQVTGELNLFSSKTQNTLIDYLVLSGSDYLFKCNNHRLEAWWYIIKRDFLLKTNLKFEEGRFMEDAIFSFKIFMEAKRALFYPMDVHRYVKTPDSIMNNETQEHLLKLIEDYISLIFRFDLLIEEISKKNATGTDRIIKKIKFKSEESIFLMFFKIIKSKISIKKIDRILINLKAIDMYPLTSSIREVYTHKKIAIMSFIFNQKYLFYFLLYPFRILYRFKLIKLL
ncbi:glycosyltransferase [Jejuia spongiicola]|uniref:Glycosyltransferase n=1 Tax=Jejuia spongiicola TaxID=2942207 RepID=A0ABT0QD74_9FLAO|nr:glycosyltransferase [Jejuia spongiicola]MCL6294932.1 glycosyltransferase [Jejuia spongiicola]